MLGELNTSLGDFDTISWAFDIILGEVSTILIKYYILIIKHLNGISIIQRMTYTVMHPMTF